LKTTSQKLEEIKIFYKEAFCIDGEVELRTDLKNFKITGIMELNDSKRGKFFIGCLKEN
jgi:hypothetical protein